MRRLLGQLGQDARFTLRSLRATPGFTLVAVLTLALGIGANTAIFSVVRGILLRPLPFQDPERLVMIGSTYGGGKPTWSSPTNMYDWRAQASSFTGMSLFDGRSAVLTGVGDPERYRAADVNADFFAILGVRPLVGRLTFTDAEASFHGPKAVLLHESFWRTRFGGDPRIVGSMITLDNERYLVAGVVPGASAWPSDAQLWFCFTVDPLELPKERGAVYVQVVSRLKPGVSLATANAELRTIAARLEAEYPHADAKVGAVAVPLREWITGDLRRPLLVLLGGVVFVLLIACANVAGLLVVRGMSRAGELAVRTALGAGSGRLVRQLVTESVVLSLIGAAAGLGAAFWGTRLLVQAAPPSIPRLSAIHVDGMVLAWTVGVALVTGVIFGLLPARQALKADVARTLREGGRGSAGRSGGDRARRALVVAEMALSVMLLAGAGLLIRSFDRLMHVDPGFRTENSISFQLSLPDAKYGSWAKETAFMDALMESIHAIGGVQKAGAALGMPLTHFGFEFTFAIAGRPTARPEDEPDAEVRVATPGYFATMGIPIVKGRNFTDADRLGSQKVLLITQTAAEKFFPGEDPIGHHVTFGWGGEGNQRFEGDIVGVVGDVKQFSLAQGTHPQFYGAFAQRPISQFTVVMHASRDPQMVVADARRRIHDLDPDLAVSQVKTLDQVVAESVAQPRFYMVLLATFALVAVALSAIGIYGVIAYLVGQRSREIGIRLALGASPGSVVQMIVREGAVITLIGTAIGLAGALALTQSMRALLFGVAPTDWVTYLGVTAVLLLVALVASSVPALRAARVDPALAMRAE